MQVGTFITIILHLKKLSFGVQQCVKGHSGWWWTPDLNWGSPVPEIPSPHVFSVSLEEASQRASFKGAKKSCHVRNRLGFVRGQ